MRLILQCLNFTASPDLKSFIDKKIGGLDKFYDKIIDAEVYLKVGNDSENDNKYVEVKINVPGDELIVKKAEKSFEEGVSNVAGSLRALLIKRKEKLRST